jgi:hypothetical protein
MSTSMSSSVLLNISHLMPWGYPGDIFRPAGLSRQTMDVSHESFSLKPFE